MLTIHLFGGLRVEVDGGPAVAREWRRRHVRTLATLLALAPGHVLHREQLVDVLWPDLDLEAGANQLHKTVHYLRRALGAGTAGRDLVGVERERVRLAGDTWVDAIEFLRQARTALAGDDPGRIDAALAIANGPYLPDDPYEPWAEESRREVDELRLRLLHRLAELHLRSAEPDAAEPALLEIVRLDPTDEAACRGLMALCAMRRDWRSAIRHHAQLRDALWREIGVQPAPETEQLRQDILASMLATSPAATDADRAAMLEEMADALREAGKASQAAGLYEQAIELYQPDDDAAARRVHGKIALTHIVAGDIEAAEAHVGSVRDSLEHESPDLLTGRTLYLLASLRWHSGRHSDALDAAEQAVRSATASGDPEDRARALEVLALACHALGDWRRGIEAELERERIAADTGFGSDEVLESHLCLWEYSLYGDRPFGEVEDSIRGALDRAEEAGKVRAMAVAEHAMGSMLMAVGRWPEARLALARSVRLARSVAAAQGTVLGLQRLALLETVSGDIDGGHRRIVEALDLARASASMQVRLHSFTRIDATLAINRFLAGDVAAASDALEDGARMQHERGECVTCDSLIHPAAVPIRLAAGDLAGAEDEWRSTEATASSFHGPSRAAMAQHAGGLVLAARGEWLAADHCLSRAAASFEAAGQPYELGRSLVALAAVRRAGGGRDWDVIHRRARDVLQGLGADLDPDRLDAWLGIARAEGRFREGRAPTVAAT